MTDETRKFAGFPPGRFNMTEVPAPFFNQLVPLVDDLAELKVLLFCFWALPQKGGQFPYLRRSDFANHEPLMEGLAVTDPNATPDAILDAALERAVRREALLWVEVELDGGTETLYFANTERGRAAVDQVKAGQWQPGDAANPVEILPERPNIYRLYEDNIGPLTPMIADELKDMEQEFPPPWLADAMRIAVEANKRNLRYIRAILERWRSEGRDASQPGGGLADEDGKRYVSGKYADFFKQ